MLNAPLSPAASQDVEASSADVDPLQFEEITGGEPDVMDDILGEFALTAEEQVTTIGDALAARDVRAAMRAAHTLKGSSGIIGAEGLRSGCLAVERAAQAGDLAAAVSLVTPLRERHSATIAALKALVAAARVRTGSG
jgi:HPt (histidine-containing phosphotransfer) domain-containing protein